MITLIYSEVWLSTSYSTRVSRGRLEKAGDPRRPSEPDRSDTNTEQAWFHFHQPNNNIIIIFGGMVLVSLFRMADGDTWSYSGGVVAIVQLICMLHMPEFPVWLHQKGRIEEANSAFNGIPGDIQNNLYFKADTPPRSNF